MQLTTIVGNLCGTNPERHRARMNRAGKLFSDKDFETLKLDRYGVEVGVWSGATKQKNIQGVEGGIGSRPT